MNRRAFSIRIPEKTYQLFKKSLSDSNVSMNQQILILIHDWLGLRDPQESRPGRPFGTTKNVKVNN